MNLSKKAACRKHATRRLAQRYNLTLNQRDHHDLVARIQRNDFVSAQRQTNRTSRITLAWKGQTITVVYDKHRKCLVTALPPKRLSAPDTMEATTR